MNLKKKIFVNLILILFILLLSTTTAEATSLFDNLVVRSTNVFTMQTLGASVGEEHTDGDFNYVVNAEDDTTVTITKYNGTDTNLIVPNTLDGYIVSAIGDCVFDTKQIETIKIPETVTSIGNDAFALSSLKKIEILGIIETIGDEAFLACEIQSIVLKEGLKTIGTYAFGRYGIKKNNYTEQCREYR